MSEEKMGKSVAESFAAKDARPVVDFEETWLAAEARYRAEKRRYRAVSGIAISLALIAVVIGMLPSDEKQQLPEFELASELMNTTLWSAPSDALMPNYPVDLYQELPQIMMPTDLSEGTLL